MKKCILCMIAVLLVLITIGGAFSYAWLGDNGMLANIGITSHVHKSYFESGDGTGPLQYQTYDENGNSVIGKDENGNTLTGQEGCAFEIKYPVQLYYFAWLQYFGFFNQPVGETTVIDQTYFYLSEDLDMTGWVLPPIGTTQYPFVGNFDGNGHTISNLTVYGATGTGTSETYNDLPVNSVANAEIIGFFGVIGSLITTGANAGTVNAAVASGDSFTVTPGYTYTSSVNSVSDFTIDGVTIKNETDNALIGAIAGYVNGTVSNTAVADTDIVVDTNTNTLTYTENMSDYSLVGYCTDAYKFTLNVSKVTLHAPGETQNIIYKNMQGEGAGFGGSVNMYNFYNRMYSAYHASSQPTRTTTVTRTVDVNGAVTESESGSTTDQYHYAYNAGNGGNYTFVKYKQNQTTDDFYYVYGDLAYSKTVNTTTYSYQNTQAFYITDGTRYLNLDSNHAITVGNSGTTKWMIDNSGYIYAVEDASTTSQNYYYLNRNGTTGLQIGNAGNTVWTKAVDSLYFTNGGINYYVYYNGNNWSVISASYKIVSSDGYYLNVSGTGATGTISYTTIEDNATLWLYDANGYIYSTVGSNTYYLRNNTGTLSATTSTTGRTVWTIDADAIHNESYFLRCVDGTWSLYYEESQYYITDGNGNYLSTDGSSIIRTNQASAVKWTFSNAGANPSGTVSTVVGDYTYYLYYNNSSLTPSRNNSTNWGNNGSELYLSNNTSYFLSYTGSNWTVSQRSLLGYTISSGSNYLNATGTSTSSYGTGASASNVTNKDSNGNTVWAFSTTGDNPSGTISTRIGNTTYYLYWDWRNGLQLSTSNVSWDNNSNVLSYNFYNYRTYYLRYSNGWSTNESSGTTLTFTPVYSSTGAVGSPVIAVSNTSGLSNSAEEYIPEIQYSNTTEQVITSTSSSSTETRYNGSNATFFPINSVGTTTFNSGTAAYSSASDKATLNGLLAPSDNNTGYVVSGNQLGTQTTYGSSGAGDIRISQYASSSISTALNSSSATTTYRTISNGTYFLNAKIENGTPTIYASTTATTKWTNSNNTWSTVIEGTTYYLYHPNNAAGVSLSTTSATWNGGTNTLYYGNNNNNRYYLKYLNSNWTTATGDNNNTLTLASITGSLTDTQMEVITAVHNGNYNGFYRVSDDYNGNNSSVSSSLTGLTKVAYTTLGLKRYEDARAAMSDTFNERTGYIYGLHFMNASINQNNYVVIPEANINGEIIEDFKVPTDSIDFFVKRRGFITVFAGTYFSENNAFFSLHEIQRYAEDDEEVINGTAQVNDIKWIKEISRIYHAQVGSDFIYEYTTASGGGYSSDAARGELAFDMAWMTNPSTMIDNAVYYFEIPVNSGEYALGSVTGKTGAYLFYLDIAANAGTAEDKDRVTVTEKFIDESYSVVLPKGVQLVESGETYDSNSPYEIVTVKLEDDYSGTYHLERTGDVFSYTSTSNAELTYLGDPITASGSGGTYTYMPNGYEVEFIEHITDKGRDTNNYDHILVKTVDSYNTAGTREGRTVYVYADIENLEVNETVTESTLELIVTFTYNPSGHDSMITRIARASSDGGFNIAFNETITSLSAIVDSDNVHVNFGDNTASVLITATSAAPLSNQNVPAVDMSGGGDIENTYYASVYGDPLASYTNYYEGAGVTVNKTTAISMPKLDSGNANQSRNLTYAITLTPESGLTNGKVYGRLLIDPSSYTYTTKVLNAAEGSSIIDSGTVTVSVTSVTINSTALTTTPTTITLSSS